jgi:hypothetical protein
MIRSFDAVFRQRLTRAIAGGFTLWTGCGGPDAPSSSSRAVELPTSARGETTTTTATSIAPPILPSSTTCSPSTQRETRCLAKNTGPDAQVPNPAFEFDAQGCVSASAMNSVCNGVHGVLSGPTVRGGECCYEVCAGVVAPCGRPLAVEFTAPGSTHRVAPPALRDDWARLVLRDVAPTEETPMSASLRPLAAAWREDALQEHASIASFARFVLELLSVGAPPVFVMSAVQAGLDEIEHARLCFALASAYHGAALGPGPLALEGVEPRRGLAAIAGAAAEEGCCGETYAALAASRAGEACTDERAARVLERIARDEEAHAELGWRFVAWAVAQGDEAVVAEVERGFARGLASLENVAVRSRTASPAPALSAAGRVTGSDLAGCIGEARELIDALRRDLFTHAV